MQIYGIVAPTWVSVNVPASGVKGQHTPAPATSISGSTLKRESRFSLSFANIWKQYYSEQIGHPFSIWQLKAGHPSHHQPGHCPDSTGHLSDTLQRAQGQI